MSLDHHPPRQRVRPPRKTRPAARAGTIVAAVLAVAAMVGLFLSGIAAESLRHQETAEAGTGTISGPPERSRSKPSPTPSRPPGVGRTARDGKFAFVVTQVDCSPTAVGLEQLNRTANGRYCVVGLTVRNIADEPQYFLGKAQKAIDLDGVEYTNDEIAGLWANRFTPTFLRKIDPGRQVVGKLVFDIPKTTTLTTMELHDSLLSGGVLVTLK